MASEPGSNAPPVAINCWSGPRCCSTSLMYSFAQRPECDVLDEPLYASYLSVTGHERPYKQLVGCWDRSGEGPGECMERGQGCM